MVIRHDDVPLNGKIVTLYSSYLHLSQITVTEGTKIRKGDMLGRGGSTGISTTPHLYFSVETADAPFHPYWPFTTAESNAAGLDFFGSIDAGLGKDKAEKYTINPMTFVNTYLGGAKANPTPPPSNSTPTGSTITNNTNTLQIAAYNNTQQAPCQNRRWSDVPTTSALGRIAYPISDQKCLLQ